MIQTDDRRAEGGHESESRAYDPRPDAIAAIFDMLPTDGLLFAACGGWTIALERFSKFEDEFNAR
jgi:hypothetical protein